MRLLFQFCSNFQVFKKLTTFLKSLGVKAVFDTSCSRDLSLIESCNEFISRYKQIHSSDDGIGKSSLPMIASACPGIFLLPLWVFQFPLCDFTANALSLAEFIVGRLKDFIDSYHVVVYKCCRDSISRFCVCKNLKVPCWCRYGRYWLGIFLKIFVPACLSTAAIFPDFPLESCHDVIWTCCTCRLDMLCWKNSWILHTALHFLSEESPTNYGSYHKAPYMP